MTKKVPVSTIVPFGLRLQPDLKARLEDEAAKNNRSLNAEIAERLARSLEEPRYPDEGGKLHTFEDVERRLQNLARQMDLKLRLVKANQRPRRSGPEDEPPGTTKRTIPKK
ncbi:Arc family DNA-binding protein [Burkholderia multivorans]|uniref:Arc family DNA-binding protein n=1 Tax=Burkholderia multivorans TaxID=87883 RepID=UPI000F778825|nr:Arc family DNA-binding protein [Burkholderia multivorans]QGR92703.1 Arc family DNA-binding protein [Burkholderia multivorans]RSB74380.1 Arc family DNA-binding protein [Burkholderia multivorans]